MIMIDAEAEIERIDREIADPRNADGVEMLMWAKIELLSAMLHRPVRARVSRLDIVGDGIIVEV